MFEIGIGVLLAAGLYLVFRIGNSTPDLPDLEGSKGVALETFDKEGWVEVLGERWRAESRSGIINKGDHVVVLSKAPGLLLLIRRVDCER